MLSILIKEAEEREKKNAQSYIDNSMSNDKVAKNYNSCNDQEMVDIDAKRGENDKEREKNKKKMELERFWEKNKHSGCTAKQGWSVFMGHAVVMTKVDVSSNNPWGMYNYYRMQVKVVWLCRKIIYT